MNKTTAVAVPQQPQKVVHHQDDDKYQTVVHPHHDKSYQDIDQLRSRVDAVLKKLVQSAETDHHPYLRGAENYTTLEPSSSTTAETIAIKNTKNKNNKNKSYDAPPSGKQWVVDPYGDQGQYEGDMEEENDDDNQTRLPHGVGTMEYTDGRIYTGEWNHGQWHGKGKAIFCNKDVFEGLYHQDQRHGYGTYQWNDGRQYQGEFCMDQRQGHGVYQWPDGAKYEGDFHKGLRHGHGLYTFNDGSVYKGEWQRGKYHGKGECHWEDGRIYKGDWVSGKAHGYGVEVRPDGSIRHDGQWENDKPLRDKK